MIELGYVARLKPEFIVPAVSDEEARAKFPNGWRVLKTYLRLTPQPR
jgi:hypothetical protein